MPSNWHIEGFGAATLIHNRMLLLRAKAGAETRPEQLIRELADSVYALMTADMVSETELHDPARRYKVMRQFFSENGDKIREHVEWNVLD